METESKFVVIPTGKPYLDALKWVVKATVSTARDHPRFEGIWSTGHEIFATNGICIHLAELKPDNPFPEGNWLVRTIQPTFVVLEKSSYDAPKIHDLMDGCAKSGIKPDTTGEKYQLKYRVDDRLLRKALDVRTSQNGMLFTAINGPVVLEGDLWIDDKWVVQVKLTAVIMPLHYGGNKGPMQLIPV